jgi:hypothetical protein
LRNQRGTQFLLDFLVIPLLKIADLLVYHPRQDVNAALRWKRFMAAGAKRLKQKGLKKDKKSFEKTQREGRWADVTILHRDCKIHKRCQN